jgi:hypothetical protein
MPIQQQLFKLLVDFVEPSSGLKIHCKAGKLWDLGVTILHFASKMYGFCCRKEKLRRICNSFLKIDCNGHLCKQQICSKKFITII